MEISRCNSTLSSVPTIKTAEIKKQIVLGTCTFIRLIYGGNYLLLNHILFCILFILLTIDNQQILLNSYASCRRLLDHMKPVIGVQQDGKKKLNFFFLKFF